MTVYIKLHLFLYTIFDKHATHLFKTRLLRSKSGRQKWRTAALPCDVCVYDACAPSFCGFLQFFFLTWWLYIA